MRPRKITKGAWALLVMIAALVTVWLLNPGHAANSAQEVLPVRGPEGKLVLPTQLQPNAEQPAGPPTIVVQPIPTTTEETQPTQEVPETTTEAPPTTQPSEEPRESTPPPTTPPTTTRQPSILDPDFWLPKSQDRE